MPPAEGGHGAAVDRPGGDATGSPAEGVADDAADARRERPVVVRRLPEVIWVSVHDNTRAIDDLEDRAARFDARANVLTVNADFRVYTGIVRGWLRGYPNISGARAVIGATVREWFKQQLIEVIFGVQGLAGSPHWQEEDVAAVLDPRALTNAVLVQTPALARA